MSIQQDKFGFIWIGGRNGVARYDGYRFHNYTNIPDDPNSLSHNVIRDLYEDSYGEMWFAAQAGGAMRLNREADNFYIYTPDSEEGRVISSLVMWKVYEDRQRNLWVAGSNGLNLYDRENDRFDSFLQDTELANYPVVDIEEYRPDEYLIGTELGGLFVWKRQTNELIRYVHDADDPLSLPHMLVRTIHVDTKGRVWVGSERGLSQFFPERGEFVDIDLSQYMLDRLYLPILEIFEDREGVYWLSTDGGGLLYFYPNTGEIGQYLHSSLSESALSSPYPRTVYQDRNGDYWIGNFPKGINYFDRSNTFFKTYRGFAKDAAGAYSNDVWAFFEEENGDLWIGVDNAGVVYFDRKKDTISRQYKSLTLDGSYSTAAVLSIYKDSNNTLWLGTWAKGLYKINLDDGSFENYYPDTNDPTSFSFENVWRIHEDRRGDMWFATNGGGVNRYVPETNSFVRYLPVQGNENSVGHTHVWSIYEDVEGLLWFGTTDGVSVYNVEKDQFRRYAYQPGIKNGISNNWVMAFLEDSKNRFWITTSGGGVNLLDREKDRFTHIRKVDGLASDSVFGVLEDNQNNLWFSTRGGLTQYNPETQTLKSYNSNNWLQDRQFHIGSYLKLSSGELVFGGVHGFSLFDPKEITFNEYAAPIHLTEVKLFGKTIKPGIDSLLEKDISISNSIELNYDQNMLSLEFSLLNYRVYKQNRYFYRLVGFDQDWIGPTSDNAVTYTNLNAGNYEFQVKAVNNDGVRSSNVRSLNIRIFPAPWRTWWAYLAYALAVLSLFLMIFLHQRRKLHYEHEYNLKLQHIDRLKDDFLANTSHELRTPLNGIIGMAEALSDGSRGLLSKSVLSDLEVIIFSGRRLSFLINDILDFSKVRRNKLSLLCSHVKLPELINNVTLQCRPLITENVELVSNVSPDIPSVYADENRLQQILHNLIGNAIKFTDKGQIVINARVQDKYIVVSIKDTGVGMSSEDLELVFESFEQLHNSNERLIGGTGLGLAVTKQLVELHGGKIHVQSTLGIGSVFSFNLPIDKIGMDSFDSENIVSDENFDPVSEEPISIKTDTVELPQASDEVKTHNLVCFLPEQEPYRATVLVVDDENVNRQVLRFFLLKQGYRVFEAKNGVEALDAFSSGFSTDLILLDVMMPKISGYVVCEELRKSYDMYRLPILFVSAKSQGNDLKRGFDVGGNDFLFKPVNKEELYAKVERNIQYSKKIEVLSLATSS